MGENVFPKRMQALRKEREMSQDELARKAKLQPTAISHFETGSRKPSFENLRALADALETTVDYLMGRTSTPGTVLEHGDQLFRDYDKLTEDERDIARDFMATLARRRNKGGQSEG